MYIYIGCWFHIGYATIPYKPIKEVINTMKSVLVKHILLVCVLWLLTCCTGAVSEDYTRTMWVSTTGEDSPQCIHDTPTSDPVHHPQHLNESCGSPNYALTHIGKNYAIVIGCGIHVLEPVDSLLNGMPLMSVATIAVMGTCENGGSQIQCTNRANLAFYNIQIVVVKNVAFQDCGEQLQYSDSLLDLSTLYFQDCKKVIIQYILLTIIGPYGRGISFIKYGITITNGDVLLEYVRVDHFGNHASGIHFEVFTGQTRDPDASLIRNHEKYQLVDIYHIIHRHQHYCEGRRRGW